MSLSSLPLAVGRIQGSYSVGRTGAANYSIPVWTPPGARGVEPHLRLNYVSGSTDEVMGPGWSLAGLSSITRCNQSWAQDGARAPITLTLADKFCFEGNRLRLTSGAGTYGQAGSTYQTEIETFSRFTAFSSAGNGPSHFVMEGKDGLYYEFGNSADSKIYATGTTTPYAWALSKIRDRDGNNLIVTYQTTSGAPRPSSIQYTQTPSTSLSYPYLVSFGYEARVANQIRYVAGAVVKQTQRLSSITIQSSGSTVRTYNLEYTTSAVTQRERLTAVQECTTTDCVRPTNIVYQPGSGGWSTTGTGTGITVQNGFTPLDLNGDAVQDVMYATFSGGNFHWYARIGTSSGGYGAEIDTGIVIPSTASLIPGSFSGRAEVQFLAPISGVWQVYTFNGSGFSSASTGLAVGTERTVLDYDGDGLPDLLAASGAEGGSATVRRNITTPGGSVAFAGTTQTIFTAGTLQRILTRGRIPTDFNGDGREDVLIGVIGSGKKGVQAWRALLSNGFGPAPSTTTFTPAPDRASPADWNGDGCTDVIAIRNIYISDCIGGFTVLTTAASVTGSAVMPFLGADWDGDGQADLLYVDFNTTVWHMQRSTGDGIAAPVSLGISQPMSGQDFTKSFYLADHNSDGQPDLGYIDTNAGFAVGYHAHLGFNSPPDLVTSVTDGFGMAVTYAYKSTAATGSCYARDSAPPTFPGRASSTVIYTACSMTASDGIGSNYQVTFSYYNANVNLQGRGFLGFQRRFSTDNRKGTLDLETYSQTFPHIGTVDYALLRQPNGVTKLRETTNTLDMLSLGSGFEARFFPYVRQILIDDFEYGGALNGQIVKRTSTSTTMDSFGTPSAVTMTVSDQSSASPFFGETFTVATANTITNDTTNWCLGRPSQTTVASTIPGGTSLTRTATATVDYVRCRNTQEVIEPSSSTLRITTTYDFDTCGNMKSIAIVGKNPNGTDMPERKTLANYGTRCQFPESTTDAEGFSTAVTYRYDLGAVATVTDPNGLQLAMLYDGYGRKTQETRPDGTSTTWSFGSCDSSNGFCGVPDLRWVATQTDRNTALGTITYKYLYSDGFNRLRYDERLNLTGSLTNFIKGYDSLGRSAFEYMPFSVTSNGYRTYSYDLLDRVVTDSLFTSSGTLDRQATATYAGTAATWTDPKGNPTTRHIDVRGKLRRVVDPSPGGTTTYGYDPFGNLTSIADAISANSSFAYNLLGSRTGSNDPNSGNWTYSPNSLGEVVSQTDAKSQSATFVFDRLGRMTSRTEPEGTSTWTWGISSAAKNIGKLASVSGPGYSEAYTYDSLGRPLTTTYTADTTYQVDYAYSATTGLLDNVTYPTSTSGFRLRAQYLYTNGILDQIRDFNTPSTVWWRMNAQDDRGNPIEEQLGNGARILNNHDVLTGHLNWRTSGTNAQYNNQQNISYFWDKNENLIDRVDVNQANLTEHFVYDALDRLDSSTRNGTTNLDITLDAAGNILHKSDVGNYTYHPTKRHAVASTSNGWTFSYDANGNMQTGRGATITWFSYNLPNSVTNGGVSSQFSYTPDRRYWRQVAQYSSGPETTVYIGGLLEKVVSATATEFRHLISAGSATVVVSRSTAPANNTYYVTTDHLGSSNTVTNTASSVLVQQSFDAYGKRRGSNWTGSPTTADMTAVANTTRRGYTGHTMLDNLGLTHMNGRLYDPAIGRFTSVDPVMASLGMTQSLNAYGYVENNPLRNVDPTGLASFFEKLFRFITSALLFAVPGIGPYLAAAWNAGIEWVQTGKFSFTVPISMGGETGLPGSGPTGSGRPEPGNGSGDWGSGVIRTTEAPGDFGIGSGRGFGHGAAQAGYGGGLVGVLTTVPVLSAAGATAGTIDAEIVITSGRIQSPGWWARFVGGAAALLRGMVSAIGATAGFLLVAIATPSNGWSSRCRYGEIYDPCKSGAMTMGGESEGSSNSHPMAGASEATGGDPNDPQDDLSAGAGAAAAGATDAESLIFTHGRTMSRRQLELLKQDIAKNGIKDPIKYVRIGGQRYVVDGHHRLMAARQLGMREVPAQEVKLPYGGYRTINDLFDRGW